jgi:ribulose-5-phosphate 4-epimerase/fuculose-1-phosphate aldolase
MSTSPTTTGVEEHRDAIEATKARVIEALQVLDGEGMFEKAFGHISARVPGTDLVCMMGHVHDLERTLAQTRPEDLIVIDLDGTVLDGRFDPPGEFPIHTEVLRNRPDVGCVVHCHPRFPVTLSITRTPLKIVTWRSSIFHPGVPLFDDCRQIETAEHGQQVADALGEGRAVILTGHGVVCVGVDPGQAAVVTLDLDDAARFQLDAMAAGGAHELPDAQVAHRGASTPPEAEGFTSAWNFFRAKYCS